MLQKAAGMSARIRFILLYLGENPIELATCHFPVTELANARNVDLQGRAAVWTVEIRSGVRGLSVPVTYKGPVFAPSPQLFLRAADHLPAGINSIVVALSPD